ncbi:unnamed protein product [Amoebophrya sp. A25]|nr:unnamed protein product [Amoebophrya sp. A25]|eukprot:GSA25T00011397001.1
MASWGPKNVFTPTTLCGNWSEDRWDVKFQEKVRYSKVYSLPTRSAGNWSKTSDAHGDWCREEMIKKNTVVREIDYLKRDDIDLSETYATTQRAVFTDPKTRPVSPDVNPFLGKERFLEDYRKTWTSSDGHQFYRKRDM